MNESDVRKLLESVSGGKLSPGSSAGAAEASAVRGHWLRQGGSPSSAAAGLRRSDFWQGQDAGTGGGNCAHHAEAQRVAEQCAGDACGRENVCRREARQPQREIPSSIRRDHRRTHARDYRQGHDPGCFAGTSDIPVAEEAVLTAQLMGNRVEQLLTWAWRGFTGCWSTGSI